MESKRRYDIKRLSSDLRQIAEELQQFKKHLRRSNYNPTYAEYHKLHDLKSQATELCCLRANHRGKMHLPNNFEKNHLAIKSIEGRYILEAREAA